MKKTLYQITTVVMMCSQLLSSCTKGFEEKNTDPNNIPIAKPGQLLAPTIVGVLSTNLLRNRNFTNELMQVSVDPTDAEGRVFRYDIRSDVGRGMYDNWYNELTNIKDIYKLSSDSTLLTYNRYYMGVSLILQVWVHSLLTDTFGDVPYFQSNKGKDSLIFAPAFDPQKDIYLDMFKKLEQANLLLAANARNTTEAIESTSDPLYNGDKEKWRKFGNSLYLRLLLRVSGKAGVSAEVISKIKEIVDTKASTYPRIASNAESAVVKWTGAAPYISPLGTVRPTDYDGPGVASFFIDNLVNWNDPRIDIPTYGLSGINRWGIAPSGGRYFGIPSGYSPGTNPVTGSYFYSNTSAQSLQKDPMTGILMNFAELQFILAEAALKGWINTGTPATYYNNGALAGITYWLPDWTTRINPATGAPGNINTYLTAADIEWEESLSVEEKMERIHLQKYYALFLVDLQQWFEHRRTGHPMLPKGAGLLNGGIMPARLTYPVYVQSTNPSNYKLAIASQGADLISTPVWWQKP